MFLGLYERGTTVAFATANPGPAFVSFNGGRFGGIGAPVAAAGLAGYFIVVLDNRTTGTLGTGTVVIQGGASDEVHIFEIRDLVSDFTQTSRVMQTRTNEATQTAVDNALASLTRRFGDLEVQMKKLGQAKTV